jgi:uncharacterized protein (DUF1778 family)
MAIDRRKEARLEARIPRQVKDVLERAAQLQGPTLTAFITQSALADALLNPQPPNDRLRAA